VKNVLQFAIYFPYALFPAGSRGLLLFSMSRLTPGPTHPLVSGCQGWSGWSMKLTTHWQVVPRFRMRGAIHLLPVLVLIVWTQTTLPFYSVAGWDKIWVLQNVTLLWGPRLTQLLASHVREHFTFCHRVMRCSITAVETELEFGVMLRYLSVLSALDSFRLSVSGIYQKV